MKNLPPAKRKQEQLEAIFQANKDEIFADLNKLENRMADIATKWEVGGPILRRWAERLGIDAVERRKQQSSLRGATGIVNKKKSPYDDKPQAHKLAGLW